MGSDLLLTLGTLTLGGAAAVMVFALTARLSRARYAARWRCWIWALLCLRLVIPFSFWGGGEKQMQAPIQLTVPQNTVIYEYRPAAPSAPAQESDAPAAAPSETPSGPQTVPGSEAPADETVRISLTQILLALWLAGMAVVAAWALIAHLRFVRYVRRWSRPVEHGGVLAQYARLGGEMKLRRLPRLRMCPGLRAPMLAGLISPALLLPAESLNDDAQTTRCVLVHELTHYKRRDIWLKTLALCANVVHWFNPFMWYMIRLVERDTELACDEAALRRLPPEDHPAYGRAILDAAARTTGKK